MNLKESIDLLLQTGRATDLKVTKLENPLGMVRIFNPVTGVAEDYTPPPASVSVNVATIDDLCAAYQAYKLDAAAICGVGQERVWIDLDRRDSRRGRIHLCYQKHPAVAWLESNSGRQFSQEDFINAIRSHLRGALPPSLRGAIESISVQNLQSLNSSVQQGLSTMKGEQTRQLTGIGIPNGLPERVEFSSRWFIWPATPGFTLSLELYVRFKSQTSVMFELWADPADLAEQERIAMLAVGDLIRTRLAELGEQVPVIV